jgi:uncharacterized protein (TIGR03118 family)
MHGSTRKRGLAVLGVAVAAVALATAAPASGHDEHTTFTAVNLVSDQPGKAMLTDPNLVNAWGLSHGPNTPIWASDNGTDVTTLYRGAVGGSPVAGPVLTVGIPGGAPTGQTFNDTSGFVVPGTTSPALFIFASENGVIAAWNQSVTPLTEAVQVAQVPGAVFKGLALVHSPFGPLLLATNFHSGKVDVFDSTFTKLNVDGLFSDHRLPRGYAPFNVAEIDGHVFVTYAKQDAARHDDVAGPGHGFIDEYTTYGVLLRRFASRDLLNSPWGLLVAPSAFGSFAGDLLVGNFGDGRIHAFDLRDGDLEGTLRGANHHPIVIDGLWALILGDPTFAGPDSVVFSAGPDGEMHGLLGVLQPN